MQADKRMTPRKYGNNSFTQEEGIRAFKKFTQKERNKKRKYEKYAKNSGTFANVTPYGYIGIEKKFLDCFQNVAIAANPSLTGGEVDPMTNTVVNPQGCIGCISAPKQGDTESERDGKKILIKSLVVKGKVTRLGTNALTSAAGSVEVFVAVVSDSATNAVQLSSEDVFVNPSATAATAGEANPLKNLKYGKRFKILKSWQFCFNPPVSGNGTNTMMLYETSQFFDFYTSLNMEVNFIQGQTDANVASVADNSLHVIAFCTSVGATQIEYCSRIRFTDP